MNVVADASALLDALLDVPHAAAVRAVVLTTENAIHVPALCDVECVSALRHLIRTRGLDERRARETLVDYRDLPLTRHAHVALLERIFGLREHFTAYDATYIALAERLGAPLLTTDLSLRRAVRARTRLELLEPA